MRCAEVKGKSMAGFDGGVRAGAASACVKYLPPSWLSVLASALWKALAYAAWAVLLRHAMACNGEWRECWFSSSIGELCPYAMYISVSVLYWF